MRNGSPIQKIKLSSTLRTGIDVVAIPGLIPEFHERNACNAANHVFETSWMALSEWEKAKHIAQYILNIVVENHVQDAQSRELKKKNKN